MLRPLVVARESPRVSRKLMSVNQLLQLVILACPHALHAQFRELFHKRMAVQLKRRGHNRSCQRARCGGPGHALLHERRVGLNVASQMAGFGAQRGDMRRFEFLLDTAEALVVTLRHRQQWRTHASSLLQVCTDVGVHSIARHNVRIAASPHVGLRTVVTPRSLCLRYLRHTTTAEQLWNIDRPRKKRPERLRLECRWYGNPQLGGGHNDTGSARENNVVQVAKSERSKVPHRNVRRLQRATISLHHRHARVSPLSNTLAAQ
jgi:hypothetical protein